MSSSRCRTNRFYVALWLRIVAALALGSVSFNATPSPAQSLVAETPPLTAEEQAKRFHLPPGFEIQLVAEEPSIQKPMNMKFDAHGRLWVSHSVEYPVPATSDAAARDAITILSDFAPDGRAQKAARFADHLNIPIGLLPLQGGAIAWSIPNIYRLADTDGDGAADQRSILFGPFGITDVHGNQNAFTPWIDGWVYANHGFSNNSRVKIGGHGDEVLHMQSGNTYRFRADGSAIEQHSWGQVNPFGLSFDPLGNLYSADCHSSAVTMLLRGGYYQSFGKPHDGLGFAPVMTDADHGGTGIAGVAYSTLPGFPAEYRDVLFIGNVITNRVHCDRLRWSGSSPSVSEVEDFVTCDDPWFRPVDLLVGPDGALYIADFYNSIIGHYEVPLDHPKRDRQRGRIWRVVYKGEPPAPPAAASEPMPDLHELDANQLFALLGHANLAVRVLATNQLVDAYPSRAARLAEDFLHNYAKLNPSKADALASQASHAVWALHRTAGISESVATPLLQDHVPRQPLVHLAKAIGEVADWRPWQFAAVPDALANRDPFVRRAATEALAKHPAAENLPPLLEQLKIADPQDVQLIHQLRIAIRDQLTSPAVAEHLLNLPFSPTQREQLVAFAATAPSGPAAVVIFDEALHRQVADEALLDALPTAARYVDAARIGAMVAHVDARFAGNAASRLASFAALAKAMVDRNLPLDDAFQARLAAQIEAALAGDLDHLWLNIPPPDGVAAPSPWARQQRPSQGGLIGVMSSLAEQGERGGGTLRSPTFELPPRITFSMCGHNGLPNQADRQLNFVRLLLEDGSEVARSYPPRDDTARNYEWDLRAHAGKRGRIEVVDGITDSDGFAWIAVSDFEPSVPRLPRGAVDTSETARTKLIQLAGELELNGVEGQIERIAQTANESTAVRLAAAQALVALNPESAMAPLRDLLRHAESPIATRAAAADTLGRIDSAEARSVLLEALPAAPQTLAEHLALNVASYQESAKALLDLVERGQVSAAILLEPRVNERLRSSGLETADQLIARLTANVEPESERIANLIADRRAAYLAGDFDPARGRELFKKGVCANCHRIADAGSVVGPALDGIGNRGLDRLLEDTLDPNRNVDPAFRSVNILTDEGLVLSGFGVREEDGQLVFNDAEGKQRRLPIERVVEQSRSALSPMPGNIADVMPQGDYLALLAYLLSLKQQ